MKIFGFLYLFSIVLADIQIGYCSTSNYGMYDSFGNSMTAQSCIDYCVNEIGDVRFAVLKGNYCGCSYQVPQSSANIENCHSECPGDSTQFCGATGSTGSGSGYYAYIELVDTSNSDILYSSVMDTLYSSDPVDDNGVSVSEDDDEDSSSMVSATAAPSGLVIGLCSVSNEGFNLLEDDSMDLDKCADHCEEVGTRYLVLNKNQCWCSNDVPLSSPITNCNIKCPGNSDQICGGDNNYFGYVDRENLGRTSIFTSTSTSEPKRSSTATTYVPPTHIPSATSSADEKANYVIGFCSTNNTGFAHTSSTRMNLGLCSGFCSTERARYMVVNQFSCWCADYLPENTVEIDNCSHICPGNDDQQCSIGEFYGYVDRSNPFNSEFEKKKKSISGGAIAGIVVGVIGGLLVAGIIYWLYRRAKAKQFDHKPSSNYPVNNNNQPEIRPYITPPELPMVEKKVAEQPLEQERIDEAPPAYEKEPQL